MPRRGRKPAASNAEDDADTLACWPVAWLPVVTETDSVRGNRCDSCDAEVWVMRRNLGLGLRILCIPCVRDRGKPVTVSTIALRRRREEQRHERRNRTTRYDLT